MPPAAAATAAAAQKKLLEAATKKLITTKDAKSKEARDKLWKGMDVNGNGYLSLAEVDKGLRDILQIDDLFHAKPVILRAFVAAKEAHESNARLGADYVERSEFRLLLLYLKHYYELHMLFDEVDTSDDRRITLDEFKKALPKLQTWLATVSKVKLGKPEDEFKKLDVNGGGFVLFEEFVDAYAKYKMAHEK